MTEKVHFTDELGLKEVGELVWWTVRKPGVGPQEVKEIIDKYNLPAKLKKHTPNDIRERDAFRRATNIEILGDIEIYNETLKYQLSTTEVNSDQEHILRKLIFKLIDKNEETLELIKIADIRYIEDAEEKLNIDILKKEFAEDKDIKGVVNQIKRDFNYNKSVYPGNTIRAFIRDMVKELKGYKAIPRGGLYFVPASSSKELDIIDKIIHDIDALSVSSYEAQNVLNRQKVLGDRGSETARNIYKTHINYTLTKWEKKLKKIEDEEKMKKKLQSILDQADLMIDQVKMLEKDIGFEINHKFIEDFKEEMTRIVEDKIKGKREDVSNAFTTLKGKLKAV